MRSGDQGRFEGAGFCRGPESDGEKGSWSCPHQHSVFWPLNLIHQNYGKITVGYLNLLKVKVTPFVPNPMRCYNCSKFGHTSQRCKVAAKSQWCGKDKHEGRREGHNVCPNCNGPHASSAQDCPRLEEGKGNSACPRWKTPLSFPEARQLVEAKMLSVISDGKSYCTVVSTKKEVLST